MTTCKVGLSKFQRSKACKVSVMSFHFHFQLINDVLSVVVSPLWGTFASLRLSNLHHHLINLRSQ